MGKRHQGSGHGMGQRLMAQEQDGAGMDTQTQPGSQAAWSRHTLVSGFVACQKSLAESHRAEVDSCQTARHGTCPQTYSRRNGSQGLRGFPAPRAAVVD